MPTKFHSTALQKQKDEYEDLKRQKGASDALAESAAKSVREIKGQVCACVCVSE